MSHSLTCPTIAFIGFVSSFVFVCLGSRSVVGGPAHYMLIMDAVDTPGVAEHLRTVLDEIIQQNKNVQIVTSSAEVFQVL